jgi:2-polyprenyl-6-methoxyphenol hydroxylase-like FAD-dependent oxidoreductase
VTALRVLIVGAGIAGLATKRALDTYGIDADVVERDPKPRTTGAGLYLPANAVRALHDLGLAGPLAERAQRVVRQELRDNRGRLLAGFGVDAIWGAVGDCMAIRRNDLHELLLDAVGDAEIGFDTGVREVGRDGRVTFGDGRRSHYDLVIGADGLFSAVRLSALPEVQPRFLGQVCWRFLAPATNLPAGTWTVQLGDRGRTFLAVPAGGGLAYCSAGMDSAGLARPTGDWRALFADFAAPAADLLAYAGEAHYSPLFEVRAFEQTHPHVVLIGDAAHASSPSMAQGSAMAIEDALVLAETLASAPRGTAVPEVLATYRTRRADRLRFVLEQNHRRDQARHLPAFARRLLFRGFAEPIFRANHRELLSRP